LLNFLDSIDDEKSLGGVMGKKRCLIVDDEQDICDILSFYLERTEAFSHIVTATDGSDAMFKLENQVFDLILLDCNMPKASGITVAENIGRNNLDNICIVSGDIDIEVAGEFLKRGIKHFLVKPFDQKTFLEKINNIVPVIQEVEAAV
jgi:response regulator of citrate/malate metabolism